MFMLHPGRTNLTQRQLPLSNNKRMKLGGRKDFLQCFKRSSSGTQNQRRVRTKVKNGDSTPMRVVPLSRIASILPLRSSKTCFADVGLGFPARLALGAAIGQLLSLMSISATLCFGILIATVSSPATVTLGSPVSA